MALRSPARGVDDLFYKALNQVHIQMDLDFSKTLEFKKIECLKQIEKDSFFGACRTTWDGIYCWPRSKPDELAQAPCPSYIPGFDSKEMATKLCTKFGWWVKQDLNVTWTNYTGCYPTSPYLSLTPFDVQIQMSPTVKSYIPTVKLISQVGYSISLITLLLAFAILAFNKRLRCPRNLLHLHLFVSFIMRAFMALLKDSLFVEGVGLRHSVFYLNGEVVFTLMNHVSLLAMTEIMFRKLSQEAVRCCLIHGKWECKMFTVLRQYFILANYSWILMEGIYLHNLTFIAMFYDTSSIFWHVTMGWTMPAVFVIPWAIVRAIYEDTFCWTTHSNKYYFYIIKSPMIVSILVNLILFINIIRVLLKKLNSTSSLFLEPRISRYRKWAKSTLILMPLYGVHYALLLGLSYSDDPTVEIVWLICDQLFGSSQGFCVALLYCILNGEVRKEMRKKWSAMKSSLEAWSLRKDLSIQWKETVNLAVINVEQTYGNIMIMDNLPGDDSNSQEEEMGLTGRLLDFAPGVTEQLTEEQESALKKATVYFYKQLMIQQNKPQISLMSSSSDMCRICREAGSKEDLLTTCGCKGTMRFIHLSCLEHWLAESDSTKCELCSFQYQTVRTPKYSIVKSIILWLQNPGRRRDAREIMLDFLALIVFTPMAFFGTYMALLAAETCCWVQCLSHLLLWTDRILEMMDTVFAPSKRMRVLAVLFANCIAYQNVLNGMGWYNTEDSVLASPTLTRIVSLGCLGVIGAIDTAYLSWLLLRAQHHARAWHRWRRRNSVVKVILSPPKTEGTQSNNDDDALSVQTNDSFA